jgi:hypothetical protein
MAALGTSDTDRLGKCRLDVYRLLDQGISE